MMWSSRLRTLLRGVFRKEQVEADLDAELRAYLNMLTDRHRAAGLSQRDAESAAQLEFEGIERVKDQVREVRMGSGVDALLQDIRWAARGLAKSPGFAAVALLTLALGIGVNTAVFSVVYEVLLRPLPYDHPEQLALVWTSLQKMGEPRAPASGTIVGEIARSSRTIQSVAGIWGAGGTFTRQDNPEQVKVAFVTPNFLDVLGASPRIGRRFEAKDETALILSDGLWKRRFGADPAIVGKSFAFQGNSCTVVGVMPPDFQLRFPPGSGVPQDIDVIVPFGYDLEQVPRNLYYIRILARMKPGASLERVQEDLNIVADKLRGTYAEFGDQKLKLAAVGLQADAVRDLRPGLEALFAGAAFVLLICCVNVANLLLARASDRRKEVAVRAALGASGLRIVRQLLTEGLLLCTIAGAAGLGIGWAGVRWMLRLQPEYQARIGDVGLSWPVIAFVAAAALGSALLFGLAPGLEQARQDLVKTLRDGGRGSRSSATRGVRAALIVSEITLGFVLIVGAGLMIRTFDNIQHVRPGFETAKLLTFALDLPGKQYPNANARIQFVENWERRLRELPGVVAFGATSHLPLDDYSNWYSPYRPEGVAKSQSTGMLADYRSVTPGYFRAMETKLVAGRELDEQDRADGRKVVLVDETLARAAWPGKNPVGQKIEAEFQTAQGFQPVWAEVAGVVEHIRYHSLSKELRGQIYVAYPQSARNHISYVIRTHSDPLALAEVIRRELHEQAKDLAMSKVRPMAAYVDRAKAPVTFTAVLAGVFAGLAVLLAAIGIYGVVNYSVSRRMHEMGVRMALGASGRDLMQLVLGEGMALTAAGLALGLGGAVLASRYLATLVYGVSAMDPLTYGLGIAVIAAAAIFGCWRPATKAASANPVDAIRAE